MKDWDDLYKLYWVCVLERNRASTRAHEMTRLKAGYGENEVGERLKVVSAFDTIPLARTPSNDDTSPFTRRYDLLDA